MTSIEWTDETWNPIVGCSKISAGCQNCYAIGQAHRNAAIAKTYSSPGRLAYYEGLTEKRGDRVEWTGQVNFVPEALAVPIKWRKPRRIFVNSMSDLFHESVPFDVIDQIFAVMALTPQHTYQVLTKRLDRMLEYMTTEHRLGNVLLSARSNANIPGGMYSLSPNWPLPNVWLGVTVENQKAADDRIPLLLKTPAALRFLSCEPLLEVIDLGPYLADWVICGGESGPGARPCETSWLSSIVGQCKDKEIPVFVKQLGSKPSFYSGFRRWPISDKKGAIVAEWPEYLRVQKFPT